MPPNLGDILPQSLLDGLADRNLIKGCVVKVFCVVAGKEKLFVFLDLDVNNKNVGLLHINSDPNSNVFTATQIRREHYELKQESYPVFLEWDSFVNCSQIIPYDFSILHRLVTATPSIHKGQLSDDDYSNIRRMVAKSWILTPIEKALYWCRE